jgi:hypothetical protein
VVQDHLEIAAGGGFEPAALGCYVGVRLTFPVLVRMGEAELGGAKERAIREIDEAAQVLRPETLREARVREAIVGRRFHGRILRRAR